MRLGNSSQGRNQVLAPNSSPRLSIRSNLIYGRILLTLFLVIGVACALNEDPIVDGPTPEIVFSDIELSNPTFSKTGAFTSDSEHGGSLWGLLSDPGTDFGFDKLSNNRPGTKPPASIGGYPMGLLTRKIRASHDENWPVDLILSGFSIVDTERNNELTYATEWGMTSGDRRNGWVGWMTGEDNYPTHVMRSHAHDDDSNLDSWVFANDGSISYLWQEEGLSSVDINYDWLGALPDIFDIKIARGNSTNDVIVVSSDQLWLAMTFSSTDNNPELDVDRSSLIANISFDFADQPGGHLFGATISMSGDSEEDAIARALQGDSIPKIQERLVEVTDEWAAIQNGVVIPSNISRDDERIIRLTVNNVAALSLSQPNDTYYTIASNGGINQHFWLRDAAVTVVGLSRFHPTMSAQILKWLAAHPEAGTVDHWEWFNFDGTGGTNGSPGIDAAAWLALAIGRTYDNLPETEQQEFTAATSNIRDRLIERIREQWDEEQGHLDIQPHWDHDWWDNRLDGRTTGTVLAPLDFKFEMGPEVVWSAGLRLIAESYADSGDDSTAEYVTRIANALETNLDDFQLDDGRGLSPAIDSDGVLVDGPGLVFVWGNVVAAAFLERKSSYEALESNQDVLRREGIDFFTLQQAYYDDVLGVRQSDSNLFEWLASGPNARWGDGQLSEELWSLFDIPWAPRDSTSNGSELFIPNGLNYLMTAGFQLESLRFECEGSTRQSVCS